MPRKHSEATKLAATFLAQQNGPDAAAEALGIDARTIRGWMETVEIPSDRWEAIRDVLLARGGEMSAKGVTTGLSATLTGAGIAERNVRYGQLIARRELRRAEAETQDPAEERRQAWIRFRYPNSGPPPHRELDNDAEYRLERFLDAGSAMVRIMIDQELAARAYQDRNTAERPPPEEEASDYGDPVALRFATYIALTEAADKTEGETTPLREWVRTFAPDEPSTAAMDPDAHRAYLADLRERAQAVADEWYPSFCAAQKAIHTADRGAPGGLRLYRHGKLTVQGGTLPPHLEGLPILTAGVPEDAIDVTPDQQFLIAEAEQFLLETGA